MKNISVIITSMLVMSCLISSAQTLPLRGSLGIQPAQYKGDEKNYTGFAQIRNVDPGSAGEKMGFMTGDIGLSVNGNSTPGLAPFVYALRELNQGDPVTIDIVREGEKLTLKGNMGAMVQSIPEGTSYHKLEYTYKDGTQRAILQMPKQQNDVKPPVVFFIQGYTCQSIDNLSSFHPYQRIANRLVENGFAVFRTEKSNMGESATPSLPCEELGFLEELEVFKSAFKYMLSLHDRIDTSSIFLFGHSMGGDQAPILANTYPDYIDGIVVTGTAVMPWHEYMIKLFRTQPLMFGATPKQTEEQLMMIKPVLNELHVYDKSPKQIVSENPEMKNILIEHFQYDGDEMLINRNYLFWQELNRLNIVGEWAGVKCPVLSVYGAADVEALDDHDGRYIAQIVNSEHPGMATFHLADSTDHSFAKVATREESARLKMTGLGYWQYHRDNFAFHTVDFIVNWLIKKEEEL